MKQHARELYHSFMAGFSIGILIALTAVYEGIYLDESHFAKFFFPEKFTIPQLNKMVFEAFFILFGGISSACILSALCLLSLWAAHRWKLDRAKARRTVYAAAVLVFSALVFYTSIFAAVHNAPDAKWAGVGGFAAVVQFAVAAVVIAVAFRGSGSARHGERLSAFILLALIFLIQARSHSLLSSGTFEDYTEGVLRYFVYPSGLLIVSFLAFKLWNAVFGLGTGEVESTGDSSAASGRRFALKALYGLFALVVLLSVALMAMVGNLPVEDEILTSRSGSEPGGPARGEGFNVVILMVDKLRRDHLGCYGYERATSPFIDEMARKGIKFNNALTQCSWTLPSVATVFTGRYPTVHGAMTKTDEMPSSWITMAEAFRNNGYSTAAFVTNPYLKKIYNLDQGFDTYDDEFLKRTFLGLAIENTPYLHVIFQSASYSKNLLKSLLGLPVQQSWLEEFDRWWSSKLNAENVNRRVLRWVKKNREHPFFLYVHYIDVHGPYYERRPFVKGESPEHNEESNPQDESARYVNQQVNLYDGAIRYVDEQIKWLMQAFKEAGVYDNSLIILTSDHGEEFLEHGGLHHGGTLYEEQLEIPLLIFPSGIVRESREVDPPVGLIDLFPTLNEWLSLGLPVQGRAISLKKAILDADDSQLKARTLLFSETDLEDSIRSVLFQNRWKYIENNSKDTRELYDLADDPAEKKNLLAEQSALSTNLAESLNAQFTEFEKESVAARHVNLDDWTKKSLKAMGYLE